VVKLVSLFEAGAEVVALALEETPLEAGNEDAPVPVAPITTLELL